MQWWQYHTHYNVSLCKCLLTFYTLTRVINIHKYRHFQRPIWTQLLQYQTPIYTLVRLLKCLLKLSIGSFLLHLEYASCTSSSITVDVSNRSVAHCFNNVAEVVNLMCYYVAVVYNSCMLSFLVFGFCPCVYILTVICLQLQFSASPAPLSDQSG